MTETQTTWTPVIYLDGEPVGGIAVGVPVALPSERTEEAAMAAARHAMSSNPDAVALAVVRG